MKHLGESELAGHSPEITRLLRAWREGEVGAERALMDAVYQELRRLAGGYLRGERSDHTLQPTALVHEAYLRISGQQRADLPSRRHFFGLASQMMRRILVDHARRRQSQKRGDGARLLRLEVDLAEVATLEDPALLSLDEALNDLARVDEKKARLVELRFFGGLSVVETAEVMEVSEATIYRDWRLARAWLYKAVGGQGQGSDESDGSGGEGGRPALAAD